MGWNLFPAIMIKKAQNNRWTSEKYDREDITSYYILGLLPEKYVWKIFKKSEESTGKSSKQKTEIWNIDNMNAQYKPYFIPYHKNKCGAAITTCLSWTMHCNEGFIED